MKKGRQVFLKLKPNISDDNSGRWHQRERSRLSRFTAQQSSRSLSQVRKTFSETCLKYSSKATLKVSPSLLFVIQTSQISFPLLHYGIYPLQFPTAYVEFLKIKV